MVFLFGSNAAHATNVSFAWVRVGLAGLLAVGLTGCAPKPPAVPEKLIVQYVEATLASESGPQARSEYIALVRGDVEMELGFKVGGVLERIRRAGETEDWPEGVSFVSGEVLAHLNAEDFRNAEKSARAHTELARKEFERIAALRQNNAISQQDWDTSSARLQSAEAGLAQAQQALKDSVLRAPGDGTILARFANSGETVSAGRPVLKIANLRQMSVELGVPDRLVGQIRVGQEIPVLISALEGGSFVGRVFEVGVAAKEGTRLFRVVLKVPNPDGRIKSGMTASVLLDSRPVLPTEAVLVPLSALVSASASNSINPLAVFVVGADGRVNERSVKTDDIIRNSILVIAGLKPGERVVAVGAGQLHDGALVEARPRREF